MTKEMIVSLSAAKQAQVSAKASQSGVSVAKERMKNILYNYYDELIQAALDNITLREENEALEIALQESDDENQSLRKSLSKYESKNSKAAKNTPTVKE